MKNNYLKFVLPGMMLLSVSCSLNAAGNEILHSNATSIIAIDVDETEARKAYQILIDLGDVSSSDKIAILNTMQRELRSNKESYGHAVTCIVNLANSEMLRDYLAPKEGMLSPTSDVISFAFQAAVDYGTRSEFLEILAQAAPIKQESVDAAFSYAIQSSRIEDIQKIIAMNTLNGLLLPTIDAVDNALINVSGAYNVDQTGILAILNKEIPGAPFPTRIDLFSKIAGYKS